MDYLFNNTSVILCVTEEKNIIFVQQEEEIGLCTSSVM